MTKKFTVIIPTISRPSLAQTLQSIKEQNLIDGDEVIVVGDGHQPGAFEIFKNAGVCGYYTQTEQPYKNWGMGNRNEVMPKAKGDYLLFMDDDDVYLPGAFDAIRNAVQPDAVNIFRINHTLGLIWRDKEIRCGNVSTQSVVVPNVPEKLGVWADEYCGDFKFIESCAAKFGKVNWCDAIICDYGDRVGGCNNCNCGEGQKKKMLEKMICIVQSYDRPACRELQIWLTRNNVVWAYGEQMHAIDVTKNRIVKSFLEMKDYDYLLCVANDMVPIAGTEKILSEPGDLVYCESISAGRLDHSGDYNFNAACFRAHRKVLAAMTPPWFKMGHTADMTQQTYCDCNHFLRNAQEAGFDSKSVATIGHEHRMILLPDAADRTKWQAIFPGQWTIG